LYGFAIQVIDQTEKFNRQEGSRDGKMKRVAGGSNQPVPMG
jgi:hypothetical protein